MGKRHDAPRRQEISNKTAENRREMQERHDPMEKMAQDILTIEGTLNSLSFEGTLEGNSEAQENISTAKTETASEFDREDSNLEKVHQKSDRHGSELKERQEKTDQDALRLHESTSELLRQEASRRLENARKAALEDLRFLKQQFEETRRNLEESRNLREQLRHKTDKGRDDDER